MGCPILTKMAYQVGVPNHQISFIWTGRALGDCMAAVITSVIFRFQGGLLKRSLLQFIFRRFICKSWQKLAFLAICLLLSGGFGILVPLILVLESLSFSSLFLSQVLESLSLSSPASPSSSRLSWAPASSSAATTRPTTPLSSTCSALTSSFPFLTPRIPDSSSYYCVTEKPG